MNTDNQIQSHKEAVIYFISRLDLEMLDAVLDEQYNYNDYGKEELLYNLRIVFNDFEEGGDAFLEVHKNSCDCSLKNESHNAVTFIGNSSKRFLDLIIQCEKDKVVDVFECTSMKNHDSSVQKGARMFLDEIPF